ncbi:hypothetical protein AB0B89_08535 [Sphaerisporangium sp. NPDC049002]|uniref:hypothetical protein n=1 Tax=unclassified Sphaerisporangium TaxID=2630420 RepID=UPI00340C8A20
MRRRSPVALLLLLFSIFLVAGGTPAAALAAPARHHPGTALAHLQLTEPAHSPVAALTHPQFATPAHPEAAVSGGAEAAATSPVPQGPEVRQVLPAGTGADFRSGAGGQAPHGGLAAVPAASRHHGTRSVAAVAADRDQAPVQPGHTVRPARAPPSTAL